MKYDVITFGSATLDVFLKSPDFRITNENLILPYGPKVEVSELVTSSGGGGTNTAVGCRRLGLKTAVVARCGWDFAGKIVRAEIKKENAADELVVQLEGEKTDYSTVLIGPDGNRTILVWRGGTRLEKSVINFKKLNSFWFYIASLEGNLELLEDLVNFAQQNHIQVCLNPGSREISEREQLLAIAQKVDVFIVNEDEATRLGELPKKLPKTLVAVTAGEGGVKLWAPIKGCLQMAGFQVKMVDQTGAGDAFGAGLIAGLCKGWSIEKSLKLGVANGASVVTKIGAKEGLIKESEVDFWLDKSLPCHWNK